MSRAGVRRVLAGAVVAVLVLGGFIVACAPAPAEPVASSYRPPRSAELQVRGPYGQPVVIGVQTGRGGNAEQTFRSATLPYYGGLPADATSVSVGYMGTAEAAASSVTTVIECRTVWPGGAVIDRDTVDVDDLAVCAVQR